jgi:hypothetical protein
LHLKDVTLTSLGTGCIRYPNWSPTDSHGVDLTSFYFRIINNNSRGFATDQAYRRSKGTRVLEGGMAGIGDHPSRPQGPLRGAYWYVIEIKELK